MQIAVTRHHISVSEYFSLRQQSLSDLFRTNEITILWTKLPTLGARLVLICAPKGYSWGMMMGRSLEVEKWQDAFCSADDTVVNLRKIIRENCLDRKLIPTGLLEYSVFEGDKKIELGANAERWMDWWFRSMLLPDSRSIETWFTENLQRHLNELGQFFLLKTIDRPLHDYPARVAQHELHPPELEPVFGSQGNIPSLLNALESIDSGTAGTWLSSIFLRDERVYIDYPMPARNRFAGELGDQLLERHEAKKEISLLRVKLLRKWGWPVGVRKLEQYRTDDRHREFCLRGHSAWNDLENEVASFLDESRGRYPILFLRD